MGLLDRLLDRSVVWSFDRTGFRRHARHFDPRDLEVDMSGKRCLVTGASSGIGVEIVHGLAARGADVRMLCRDVAKGEAVRERLRSECPQGRLEVARVDLSDLRSVRRFAEELGDDRVDVLVHNAGVLLDERSETPDGLERTVATNLVGPFVLTHLLRPKLTGARIVHMSSGGMYTQRLDVDALFDPPEPFDGVRAYARTKRAQVVLAELLHERWPAVVSSMHPGWVDTPGVERSLPRFYALMRPWLRTPAEGADTAVWLAAAEAAADAGGRFFFDRQPQPTHVWARTRETAADREALWARLDEIARRVASSATTGSQPEREAS